ncbi:glycoside hydrolase family 3 protein [Pseudocercospora fijiensis CIRAD86]|uniref:xylan 1,4-beta-xylosidase n=1 Tax=Pseudocercospora fijiensis (strain CIRAD86) TaxID=383855 RepID=M3A1E0_PSEFD|nr:glycoside hydrolase family 3 protein [Pseudocercospora fijiensis CIRAD86]EME78196.1 glycoside hydrolase family 3 protein [Pseudocercospora fijiensis CIRAD86]
MSFMLAPDAGIGFLHDVYTLNKTQINSLQALNLEKSRLKIPFLHTGECLHGVGSFRQSMFPQALTMATSWDTDIIHRVGRAIGTEARAIGLHACFSPVLDICRDPRWGRCQEDWGEDHILTSHLGVAYAAGLSKNGAWGENDAVVPVMKHFAAHGASQGGLNGAPWMGHGNREVLQNLLTPFKAAIDLGGVGGVMMAYSEVDDVPSHVSPMLYDALHDWGYDGFVIADDTGMSELEKVHQVSAGAADTIGQWFNAGGMVSFYDYPLETYLNSTVELVANHTVALDTLREKMRRILGVKYDLGLFKNPYIPDDIDADELTKEHVPLALEAALKSIVLLENKNSLLPLDPTSPKKIALIGPYSDNLNFGDYSGQFGQYPVENAWTLRQGIQQVFKDHNTSVEINTAWGANTWVQNDQVPIPGYHLSTPNGTTGSLQATYYADTNFSQPLVVKPEVPVRDWGLYPPPGLPSNNFSAVWEGTLTVPVSITTEGWLGVGIAWNSTAKLYINDTLHIDIPLTTTGNFLSNIPNRAYALQNSTAPPPGSKPFTFVPGATHKIRLEFRAWNLYQKIANHNSLNSEIMLFWNLVDSTPTHALSQALSLAQTSDLTILTVGGAWNSDGESGDRSTLSLSPNQTHLAESILSLSLATSKPCILILNGARPLSLPSLYASSTAVLSTGFAGQASGLALAQTLFGLSTPGGHLPLTIPRSVGQLPSYYNFKPTTHKTSYLDEDPSPLYPFGHGLSYTKFEISNFEAERATFVNTSIITFHVTVRNLGARPGSYTAQIYLLQRVRSSITRAERQLVAFSRVYLDVGEGKVVEMEVEVDRYLKILNRRYEWEVEKGEYVFALLENGGMGVDTGRNVTLRSV